MSQKRLIIIGGVAGGASAAARARRMCEDCEIILFERGPHVSVANCGLPYFVGGEIAEQDSLLLQTPESLKARFNLEVRIHTEVIRIDLHPGSHAGYYPGAEPIALSNHGESL